MSEEEDRARALWLEFHRGPAVAANRVGINVLPTGGMRISFAEQYDEKAAPVFRAAVVLSNWNAFELWKILGGMNPVIEFINAENVAAEAGPGTNGNDE